MGEPRKLHIVMFPWLAFGHLIPFLEISKLIAQKGHQISFISTPRNVKRLPKLPPNLAPLIKFVSLPLPHVDNLPENAEATMDVPYHLVPYLKIASDGLQGPVTQFLETSTPDWIIYDFFPHWLPPIAAKLGISRAFFSIFNAWSMSFFGSSVPDITGIDDPRTKPEHFTVPPKWVPFPTNVRFRPYEAKEALSLEVQNVSGVSDMSRCWSVISGCEVLFIRSCMELEPEWLKLLGELHLKPVVPVGLIPPSLQHRCGEEEKEDTWQTIVGWLDKQEKGTVVYIALGSEATPSQEDLTELALGLELSGLPFFWALRRRQDSVGSGSLELPDGFEERVKGRGVVWTSWAPQLKILGHDSVGGFVTHCGWSSIIEGISFGRPLIMFPCQGDQGLNARFFEEKEVGMEIPRNEQDGSFTRNSVADSLSSVMLKEERKIYEEKAREMSKIFGDKELHQNYIEKVVDYLQNHRQMC